MSVMLIVLWPITLARLQITVSHWWIVRSNSGFDRQNLSLVGHFDRAFVIQYKKYYVTWSFSVQIWNGLILLLDHNTSRCKHVMEKNMFCLTRLASCQVKTCPRPDKIMTWQKLFGGLYWRPAGHPSKPQTAALHFMLSSLVIFLAQ